MWTPRRGWAIVALVCALASRSWSTGAPPLPAQCVSPRLVLPARSVAVLRGGSVDLRGARVVRDNDGDEDAPWGAVPAGYADATVSVAVQAGAGRLALAPGFADLLPSGASAGPSSELRLEGRRGAVNSALVGLRYLSPPDAEAWEDAVDFSLVVLDPGDADGPELCAGAATGASASMAVYVRELPFEPRLLLRERLIGVDNVLVATEGGEPVSLESVRIDAGRHQTALLRVHLFAGSGTLRQRPPSTDQGAPEAPLRLVGTADDVNALLARCVYAPPLLRPSDWDRVVLVMQYNPRPGGGKGAVAWADETIVVLPIRIAAAVRPPAASWAGSGLKQAVLALTHSSLQLPSPLPELAIVCDQEEGEAAAAATGFLLTVRAELGSLTWSDGAHAVEGSRQAVELNGSTAELVDTFRRLRYRPPSVRLLLFSQLALSSRIDRVVVTLRDPAGRYRSGLNETVHLDVERPFGWWSTSHALVKRSLLVNEDENTSIANVLVVDAVRLADGNFSLRVTAQHGRILTTAESSGAGAVETHAVSARDLIDQASRLWYAPPPDFHGADELRIQLGPLEARVAVRVLPVNDAPTIAFQPDRTPGGWHSGPIMALPGIRVDDVDPSDLLTVRVQAVNGSLRTESPDHPMFDGISQSAGDTGGLGLTATVERLKPLFASGFVEVAPHACGRPGGFLCAGLVTACVSDGVAPSVCVEIPFPGKPQPYAITRGEAQDGTQIVAGGSTSLASLFQVVERAPSGIELTLAITLNTGWFRFEPSACAEWYGPATQGSIASGDPAGATYQVTAPDVQCLNHALEASAFRTAKTDRGTARIGLELLANSSRPLLREDVRVSIAPAAEPGRRITVVPVKSGAPIQTRAGDRLELASLFTLSPSIDAGDQGGLVDLVVACAACAWSYDSFVPRVSYELAALPSSNLTLTGPVSAIAAVLESLCFVANPVPSSSGGVESVTVAAHEHSAAADASGTASVSFVVEEDPLRWSVRQSTFVVRTQPVRTELKGIQIVGKTRDMSLPLRLLIKCAAGSAVLTLGGDPPTRTLCGPNDAPLAVTSPRGQINRLLASVAVESHPSELSDTARIEFSVGEQTRVDDDFETTTVAVRWAGAKAPSLSLRQHEGVVLRANESGSSPLGDVLVVNSGADGERRGFLLTVRASVAHGALSVPNEVCCVEIHGVSPGLELVISGEATALTAALSATLYTPSADFRGEDSLSASVTIYGSHAKWSELPVTHVQIAVDARGTDRAFAARDERQIVGGDDEAGEWGVGAEAADFVAADAYLAPLTGSWLDEIGDDLHLEDFDESDLDPSAELPAIAPPVQPLLRMEGTLEDPLSTDSWEDRTIQADVDTETAIDGVWLVALEPTPMEATLSCIVALDIAADHGVISLYAGFDGDAALALVAMRWEASKQVVTLSGTLDSVNRTLRHLSYRCGYACPLLDAITLTVRRQNGQLEYRHQRRVRVELREPLPVPKVVLDESAVHMSEEDTAFRFAQISLSGTPSQEASVPASHEAAKSWMPEKDVAWLSSDAPAARAYALDVSVSTGTIFCTVEIAQCRDDRRSRSRTQSLLGSFAALSRALVTLTYEPPLNWNSQQHLGAHLVEWTFRVSDGPLVNETYALLAVTPRVDPPVLTVPSAVEDAWEFTTDHLSRLRRQCLVVAISEDAPFQFDGLSVRATDSSGTDALVLFSVAVSVHHGALSAGTAARCIGPFADSGAAGVLAFTAGLACVNQVLGALTYTSSPHFSGADALELHVETASTQGRAPFDSARIPLEVTEVNDAPYVTGTSREFYQCEEDVACVLRDLRLIDPDSSWDGDHLVVTITVARGSVTLLYSTDVTASAYVSEPAGTNGMVLTVEGTLAHLNRALSSVVFTSAKDWNSLAASSDRDSDWFDTITIAATDSNVFNASASSEFRVHVAPTADPVLIRSPKNLLVGTFDDDDGETLRGDEDEELSIRGLAFFSADETPRSTLFVRMSVRHGRLSLPVTRGVSLDGDCRDGAAHRVLSLRGTFENVNRSVAFVRYLPDADYAGSDALNVEAHAVDEYTREATATAALSVPIELAPVNDAPSWVVLAPSVPAQLDAPTLISGVSLVDVDVESADCSAISCAMDVTIEASHGFVSLPRLARPALVSTTTDAATEDSALGRSSFLVIEGSLAELNAALSEIVVELTAPEYYRADDPRRSHVAVSLRADDRGNFGKGGPRTSTATVFVRPVVWTAHRLLLDVPRVVLAIDEDQRYVFTGAVRIHDADAARSHRAMLEVAVRCGHGDFVFRQGARGVQVLSSDSHRVVVRGYLRSLNDALDGSAYVPNRDWFGSDEVLVSVRDVGPSAGNRSTEASMFVSVAPVCDQPSWRVEWGPNDHLEAVEGELLEVGGVSLATPDVKTGDESEVRVAVAVRHGGLALATTAGLLITGQEFYADSTSDAAADRAAFTAAAAYGSLGDSRLFYSRLQLTASVGDMNAALAGLVYKPRRDYSSGGGTSREGINLVAWANCDGRLAMGDGGNVTLSVSVRPARDPIALVSRHFRQVDLALSPEQALAELGDSVLVEAFEDTERPLDQLELVDIDNPEEVGLGAFQVTISCYHCIVATASSRLQQSELAFLAPSTGPSAVGKNVWSPQLTVVGGAKALNQHLLAGLRFRGSPQFSGLAIVAVRVDALGAASRASPSRSVVYALPVRVLELDDDVPEILLPDVPVLVVDENSSVLLRGVQQPEPPTSGGGRELRQRSVVRVCPRCADSASRQKHIQSLSRGGGVVISYLTPMSTGGLLFSAHHPTLGTELWKTDGSETGTMLFKDILPGSGSSSPGHLTPFSVDGRVYFSASGPDLAWMLESDRLDACRGFYQSRANPEAYYAVAQHNVWDPDETYDCPVGFHWMSTAEARSAFTGTEMLGGSESGPLAYFDQCGWRGYVWGGAERVFFRLSDSQTTGAYKHAGYRDSYHIETSFQTDRFAGVVCVRNRPGHQAEWGRHLWSTDGTAKGTRRVVQLASGAMGAMPSQMTEHGGRLFFQASALGVGAELWSTDGTRVGTELVADIEPGVRGSEPMSLVSLGDQILFSAWTERTGRELWRSDGRSTTDYDRLDHSRVATALVLDICAGPGSSDPGHLVALTTPAGTAAVVFQADDCAHGPELWISDGSAVGTTLLVDIRHGSAGSAPRYLTAFGGRVYFQADDGRHGAEVWVTDGTSAGTRMLLDLALGAPGSGARYFSALVSVVGAPSHLVFAARGDRTGREEFWLSDGTAAGTSRLFAGSGEVSRLDAAAMDLAVGPALVGIGTGDFFYVGADGAARSLDAGAEEASENRLARSILLRETPALGRARYSLTLQCAKGWLSLGRTCDGVAFESEDAADARAQSIVMEGTLAGLNCAIEQVTFNAFPERVGRDEIVITLEHKAAGGAGLSTTARLPVRIVAVNDPPVITMSARFFAPLDGWVSFPGMDVSDPDAGDRLLYLRVAVHHGQVRLREARGGAALRGIHLLGSTGADLPAQDARADADGGASVLEFAVAVTQTRALLGSLEYRCGADAPGCRDGDSDYLTLDVSDNGFSGEGGPQVAAASALILVQGASA